MYLVDSVRLHQGVVSENQGEVDQRRGMYQYIHLKSLLTYIINYICIEHTLASNTISRTDPLPHKHRIPIRSTRASADAFAVSS